jgi:hypothetical protein
MPAPSVPTSTKRTSDRVAAAREYSAAASAWDMRDVALAGIRREEVQAASFARALGFSGDASDAVLCASRARLAGDVLQEDR